MHDENINSVDELENDLQSKKSAVNAYRNINGYLSQKNNQSINNQNDEINNPDDENSDKNLSADSEGTQEKGNREQPDSDKNEIGNYKSDDNANSENDNNKQPNNNQQQKRNDKNHGKDDNREKNENNNKNDISKGADKVNGGGGKTPGSAGKAAEGAGKTTEGAANTAKAAASKAAAAATGGATEAIKAAQKVGSAAKKTGKESAKIAASGNSSGNKTTDSTITKVFVGCAAVIATIILIVVILISAILSMVAAPVMFLYEKCQNGISWVSDHFGKSNSDELSYTDIADTVVADLQDALSTAYVTVCCNEVYQVALENDYDIEMTMDSYADSTFPYILDGDSCNVNYAELLALISMSGAFGENYSDFDYDEMLDILSDTEFLRCLYDLDVVPTYIINEDALSEGDTAELILNVDTENSNKRAGASKEYIITIKIIHEDGSEDTYTGSDAEEYYILYGEVSVDVYPVRKIYDYFDMDPYATNSKFTNMTNYKALCYLEYYTHVYHPDEQGVEVWWGSEIQSPIDVNYTKLTGELTEEYANCYFDDVNSLSIYGDSSYVLNGVPYYSQLRSYSDLWTTSFYDSYRNHTYDQRYYFFAGDTLTMNGYGCCFVSMAMVVGYFSPETDALDFYDYYNTPTLYGGANRNLNRSAIAKHYGFNEIVSSDSRWSSESVRGELVQNRLVIAHIKKGHLGSKNGHYIVIYGYVLNDDENYFLVLDPAHADRTVLTEEETDLNMDGYRSYGVPFSLPSNTTNSSSNSSNSSGNGGSAEEESSSSLLDQIKQQTLDND